MTLVFESPGIFAILDDATDEVLDAVPFGVIRMSPDGVVNGYNQYESRLSGMSPVTVKGRQFFREVAPCTNNFMVAQKFEDAAELDEVIDYVFTFRMRPTSVRLRLLKSAAGRNQFVLVSKTT